ncbi:DUF4494 family protein [Spirosoma spitsbergense]|uniref:DUF4494 family protein n=1 Tax=Spirosoma spitsbergense TaxID=431554 RepID=UPI000373742A|nr:DUF4494 family protein [Spirosoma spitsbergense]
MLTWYQPKVKYEALDGDTRKTLTELYLFEAVTFGDVETQCYEQLKTRIKDPDVDAIAKAPFGSVIFFSGTTQEWFTDPFYRIGIKWGDDKDLYLVPAKDAEQAIERALSFHGSAEASHIVEVKKTEILAVWHPKNELWQGDWHNRMERLKEAKKHSWDLSQSDLFNADGSAKTDSEMDDLLQATTVSAKDKDGNWVDITEKLKRTSRKQNATRMPYADND